MRVAESPKIVVLDYGSGNIRSVSHALQRCGAEVELSAEAASVQAADGVVVPGVGAFSAVMQALVDKSIPQMIESRLAQQRPVLGICVGLQIMFESGDENGVVTEGLGHLSGKISRLPAERLPHMGWSKVHAPSGSCLLENLDEERFYFVHSYACLEAPSGGVISGVGTEPLVSFAHYGNDFVAAVESGPLCATQFHPEKSGDAGAKLFQNWLNTL